MLHGLAREIAMIDIAFNDAAIRRIVREEIEAVQLIATLNVLYARILVEPDDGNIGAVAADYFGKNVCTLSATRSIPRSLPRIQASV
jgi:hypothetical protein